MSIVIIVYKVFVVIIACGYILLVIVLEQQACMKVCHVHTRCTCPAYTSQFPLCTATAHK